MPRWPAVLRSLLFVVGVLVALHSMGSSQEGSPVDRLGWLAGCWEGTLSNGATYEEAWLAPRGGMMIGTARLIRDGRAVAWEYLRIVDDQGTLVYVAQPSGQAETHFRASAVDEGSVTFENPEHDFPQRVLYRLTPPDSLLARIEGERDGRTRGVDFPLARVPCPMGESVSPRTSRST